MSNVPIIGGVNNKITGNYKVMVVDSKTKEVAKDYGWHKNLILNQGMDSMSLFSYAEVTKVAIAGSGSRPNKITSSASTITQSGNIITLWPEAGGLQNFSSSISSSAPYEIYYSSSLQRGDVIVYSNASRSNVTAIDSVAGLTASVDTSYTIESGSNQTFTIWKTSQTGMHKEGKRSNTYLTGDGNCGSTDTTGSAGVVNIRTYRRTYDFIAETGNSLYTEIGMAPVTTPQISVFSRVVLPIPVAVSSSFQLRVIYDLEVEFGPTSLQTSTASISGWPVAPSTHLGYSSSIQTFLASTINTNGNETIYTALLEPGPDSPIGTLARRSPVDPVANVIHRGIFFSSTSSSLKPFGSGSNRHQGLVYDSSNGPHTSPLYVTGSYTYIKSNYLLLNEAVTTTSSGIICIGWGMNSNIVSYETGKTENQAYTMLFHQTQSKTNVQVASMSFVYTWDRVLAGT